MKTKAYMSAGSDHVIVDFYCRKDRKGGCTSLNLEEADRARELLAELSEMIEAKDYFDLIADLDRAMLSIDKCRLQRFTGAEDAA